MAIVLLASYDRPGEYLLVDDATGEVRFGPFFSNDNALIVESYVRRQLKGTAEVRLELAPKLEVERQEQ